MSTTFIYRNIHGRICCEKLTFEPVNSATGKPHDLGIVFKKVLTDEEKDMMLDELKIMYPYQQ